MADAITSLYYDNSQGCNYKLMYNEVHNHCLQPEVSCSIGSLLSNLFTVNLIETFGSFTTLTNQVKTLEYDVDSEEIYEQTLVIGKSFGTLIAVAYGL